MQKMKALQLPLALILTLVLILSGCAKTDQQAEIVKPPEQKEADIEEKRTSIEEDEQEELIVVQEIGPSETKKKIIQATPPAKKRDPEVIYAERRKKVYEFVRINGENYPVPLVWRGARLVEKSPPRSQLAQIPMDFTWNRSKLYIEKHSCDAFIVMAEKAREEGIHLVVHSGYRSIGYQRRIFKKLMADGRTWEDLVRYVAPPGYSEHVMGTVVDLYPSDWRFAATKEYSWLKENGENFGFRETYPESSPRGFPWEAWHWRYIGEIENADIDSAER